MTQPHKLYSLLSPNRSLSREEGQTLAEYALILALVALLVIAAIVFLRTQITSLFSDIGNNI